MSWLVPWQVLLWVVLVAPKEIAMARAVKTRKSKQER
jgi:hypothetical protein